MSLEGFKRAFQKAFQSDRANFKIRKDKCEAALTELRKAIAYLKTNGLAQPVLHRYEEDLSRYETALTTAERQAEKKPGDAFKALDATKKAARQSAQDAKNEVKRVPMGVTSEDGKTSAKVYPSDVPGFAKMSDREQQETVKKIANKIGKGKDLFEQVQKNPGFIKQWAPTPEDVTDLMWFIKSKAQESMGQAFERGAMTIPDDDGNLQALLDKCEEAYIRDSSHMKDQQKREGGQARGIDFYEGVEEGSVADTSRLLPSGMRTLLTQKVTTAQGKRRLYIKMETESARIRAQFYKKDFYRNEIESRPREWKDWSNSIKHLGNLIKSKLGMSQGEDPVLRTFREKVPKAIETHIKAALKAAKDTENEEAEEAIKGLQKAVKGGVTQIWAAYLAIGESGIEMDKSVYENLAKMAQAIFDIAPDVNPDERLGDEVVVSMDDLMPSPPPPSTPPPPPPEEPDTTEKALGLLNTQLAAVQGCQHTDELADLERVQTAAQAAIKKVKAKREVAEHHAVASVIKQLEEALEPLGRLIENMAQEELAQPQTRPRR
jgi:tetratricopeptide (TPR) repeat protein